MPVGRPGKASRFPNSQAASGAAGPELDLDKRVVFLHGVPSEIELAASVASLGPIPAQVAIADLVRRD